MKRFFSLVLAGLMGMSPIVAEPTQTPVVQPVVVVGSGVGALTSAVYLQRAGIPTIVIEGPNPGGAIAQSPSVHNWPGEVEISGERLIEKIRHQAEVNGAQFLSMEVTDIDFSQESTKITMRDVYDYEKVETIYAQSVILAMGSNPRLLGVPGESGDQGYWTRGVYSCAVCDGGLYRDKTVAVIGGGDSAIIEADYLSNLAKKVYIVIRSDHFKTVETLRKNRLLQKPNVEVLFNTKVQKIQGNGKKVTHLNLSTEKELTVDGVFVAIGALPNTEVVKNQLQLDDYGYIRLTDGQQTSAKGVFAIGDIVDPIYKQAVSAAGDGAKAALQVEHYLAAHGTASPLDTASDAKVVRTALPQNGSVAEIDSKEEFYHAIANGQTPLVVDFFSPYCGPCKQLATDLDEAAEKLTGKYRFLKVDVTRFPQLAQTYNVYSLPTVMVFDTQGKMVEKATGLDKVCPLLGQIQKEAAKKN